MFYGFTSVFNPLIKPAIPFKQAKITLFGSLARGDYRLDSDIDLAIITRDKSLMKLTSSIADKIFAEKGKLVSIKFIDEIKKGIVIYNGGKC